MQDASYIRLKKPDHRLQFPKELVNKIGLQGAQNLCIGRKPADLLAYSKNTRRIMIRKASYAGDAHYGTDKLGTDNFGDGDGYPVMKSYTIGLSITF